MHDRFYWLTLMIRRRCATVLALAALLAACQTTPPPVPPAPPVDNTVVTPPRPPRIGLALGGGAARGFAHIGVIQVLEEQGLRPDLVAGTSAGSLVAVLYASGMKPAELERAALAMDEATIADWTLPLLSRGMLRGQALARYVNQQVGSKQLQDLPLPVGVVATDLQSGDGIVFRRGDVGTAVRASSAVPGVFQPVAIGKYHYVDGGIVSPVPVDAARALGADLVIAVDISNKARGKAPGDLLGTLGQSIAIMGQKLGQAELARADVVIRPEVLDIGPADFSQRAAAIVEGEKAALAAMPQIRERIAQWQAGQALAAQKAAQAQHQACLEQRTRLQKIAGMAGLDGACAAH